MNTPHTPPTEAELQSKAVAPRVTLEDLEANIASEHYFTGADGVVGVAASTEAAGLEVGDTAKVSICATPEPMHLLTFCVLVLANGFTVTGESACASPENFDAEIGQRLARENAVRKVWPLMGYELRSKLAASMGLADGFLPHQRRVIDERAEIEDRLDKLTEFLGTPTFEALPERDQMLLVKQSGIMVQLSDVLKERIATFKS